MTKLQEGICGAMKHVIGIRENAFLNIIYSNVCTNRLSLTKFPSLTTTKKMSSFLQVDRKLPCVLFVAPSFE